MMSSTSSQGPDLVIHQPEEVLNKMNEVVTNMHTESGLLNQITASTLSLDEADVSPLTSLKSTVRRQEPCHFVQLDRHRSQISRRYLPEIENYLHYRSADVSSIKELVRRWYPEANARRPWKPNSHRALDDIKESVAELQHYQRVVFGRQAR